MCERTAFAGLRIGLFRPSPTLGARAWMCAIEAATVPMPIQFDLPPGTLALCDYGTGFRPPEMVKRRPVVIVSPRLTFRRGLATVVPLSTTPLEAPQPYHLALRLEAPLPPPFDAPEMWAKADMLATVSFERLDLFRTGRDQYGKRRYLKPRLSAEELAALRTCIGHALGLAADPS